MPRRLTIAVETLARRLRQPAARGDRHLRQLGPLHVSAPELPSGDTPSRWQTYLISSAKFLLLVDALRAPEIGPATLRLTSERPIRGGRRRYLTRDAEGPLALHPLGDYRVEQQRGSLTFTQRFASGRFLVVLTRDSEATARVLNGWAVEIRSQGHIYYLLHSNRSRRLRPLGPIQTDAEFGLVDFPVPPDLLDPSTVEATLALLQANQVIWPDRRKLTFTPATDLLCEIEPPAGAGQSSS